MLRSVTLGLALSVLSVGCALVEAPPPPGTRKVDARVENTAAVPVELAVTTPTGVLQGAVQPTSLQARAVGNVTFYLPPGEDWWITVNGVEMVPGSDAIDDIQCPGLFMEVNPNGGGGIVCHR